jgi:hypothetical protein
VTDYQVRTRVAEKYWDKRISVESKGGGGTVWIPPIF